MTPKITIITIVRNDEAVIEATIKSVLQQTYSNKEYIVVDGGSTDNTLSVITRYRQAIQHVVSEPDKGIYDAMNKGVAIASGEWVLFMNSGDLFYADNTLELVSSFFSSADVVYGDCQVDYGGYTLIKPAKSIGNLWKGIVCSHQSIVAKKNLLERYPFDINIRIAGDFNFLLEVSQRYVIKQVDYVISTVASDGMADTERFFVYNKYRKIVRKYFGWWKSTYQYLNMLREGVRLFLIWLLPRKYYSILRRKINVNIK